MLQSAFPDTYNLEVLSQERIGYFLANIHHCQPHENFHRVRLWRNTSFRITKEIKNVKVLILYGLPEIINE